MAKKTYPQIEETPSVAKEPVQTIGWDIFTDAFCNNHGVMGRRGKKTVLEKCQLFKGIESTFFV